MAPVAVAISVVDALMNFNNKCDVACAIRNIKIGIVVFSGIIREARGSDLNVHIPTSDFQNVSFPLYIFSYVIVYTHSPAYMGRHTHVARITQCVVRHRVLCTGCTRSRPSSFFSRLGQYGE